MGMEKRKLPPLTGDVIEGIIYGMENQREDYAFFPSLGVAAQRNTYGDAVLVELPKWTSRDGFGLMIRFASRCPDAEMKQKMLEVLGSHQKGVFRNFRELLGTQPSLLASWREYKEKAMSKVIREWYGKLDEEADGAEDAAEGREEREEREELVLEDFSVGADDGRHSARIREALEGFAGERAVVCLDPDDNLAGFISYRVCGALAAVCSYMVIPDYRRLGIFDLMYDHLIKLLAEEDVRRVRFPVYEKSDFIANRFAGTDARIVSSEYLVSLT